MAANYSFAKTIRDRVLLWLHGNRFGLYGDGQATTNSAAVLDGVVVGSVRTGANPVKAIATGLASAGAVTVAGTQVGDTVEMVLQVASASAFGDVTANFEATVSVAGQVQQISGALNGSVLLFFVNPQAAA
jgi:hypothetical protein